MRQKFAASPFRDEEERQRRIRGILHRPGQFPRTQKNQINLISKFKFSRSTS